MEKIAIMIKTFEREEYLYRCVEAIKTNLKSNLYRIYICDDGSIDAEKEKFYSNLESEGHFILRLPYNVGASAGRVALLPYITEKYILRMDDDFIITEETDINNMLNILINHENIGAISDLERQENDNLSKGVRSGDLRVKDNHGKVQIIGKTLIKLIWNLKNTKYTEYNNIRFCECDFSRNFLLIKKKMLNDVVWDYRLKFYGEHIDFMLQIKNSKKWKLVFTPDSIHTHAGPSPEKLNSRYKKIRMNNKLLKGQEAVFKRKWGINNYYYRNDIKIISYIKTIIKGIFVKQDS